MELFGVDDWADILNEFGEGGGLEGRWGFLRMLSVLNTPAPMARLYDVAAGRPWGSSDWGFPRKGDTLLITLSAERVDGRLSLLEHLNDGTTRPISVFEAGLVGDAYVAYNGQREERLGNPIAGAGLRGPGHGFLNGRSGDWIITFDSSRFDLLGAGLDSGGIIAGLIWPPAGAAVGCFEVARSAPKFLVPLFQGTPWSELKGPLMDLSLDVGGLAHPGFDVVDLGLTFQGAMRVVRVP